MSTEPDQLDDLFSPDPEHEREGAEERPKSSAKTERRFQLVDAVLEPVAAIAAVWLSVSYLFFSTDDPGRPGLSHSWLGTIYALLAALWIFRTIRVWWKLRHRPMSG